MIHKLIYCFLKKRLNFQLLYQINFYDLLQGKKDGSDDGTLSKYYPGGTGSKGQIFTTAVLLGWLHNKRSDQRANDSFLRFNDVKDEKAIGESTVLYLYYYELAIKNIKKYLGEEVKIIIMLQIR